MIWRKVRGFRVSAGDSVGSAEPGMINLNVTSESLMLLVLVTTQVGIRVTVTVTQALASGSPENRPGRRPGP